MRLTAAERDALPDSAFALPKFRKFPIYDPTHVKAGGARLSQALHEGRITPTEYARAESRVLAAERQFRMHSTVYPEHTAAFEDQTENLSDVVKLGAVGGVLAGTALLAWWLRPQEGYSPKKAAGAPGHGGLRALAATLTPQQKAVVHAARAAGKTPVEALQAAGISSAQLAAAAAR
jgi:hypothetical protein